MKGICLALGLSTLLCTLAPAATAQDGAAMSDAEDGALAARAAQMPEPGNFSGGAWVGVSSEAAFLFVLIVVGIVGLVTLVGILLSGKL